MGYYDAYNAILSVTKSTPRDSFIDLTKRNIQNDFKNNISYYQVPTYIPSTPLASTPLDVWITDNMNGDKNQKKVAAYPSQPLQVGFLFYWHNQYWLVLQNDDAMGEIYDRGIAQRCYSSIKWLDSTGTIRETWYTEDSTQEPRYNVTDGKVLIMPNEHRYLTVQSNQYTQQIQKEQRFIFDGRAWRTVGINRLLTDGTIQLVLDENQINESNDNVDLRVADYYAHARTIQILNGSSVSLATGATLQLDVQVKDNGTVTSEPVTYTTSDSNIATVDANGLVTAIADGNVTITAMLTNDNTVATSIGVNVSASATDNYSLAITGADSISVGQTQSYTGIVSNNGVVDGAKTVTFSLFADDGNSATTLANIVSQNGTSCVVSGNSNNTYGYVKLTAICVQNGSIVNTKRIQIKGIF